MLALCVDKFSGKSYEHRRGWIKQRLIYLAHFYGIDVLGYAIVGNHMHAGIGQMWYII